MWSIGSGTTAPADRLRSGVLPPSCGAASQAGPWVPMRDARRRPGAIGKIVAAAALLMFASLEITDAQTQTRKPAPARKPAPPPAQALTKVVPDMKCQSLLGTGVETKLEFCDILSGRTPLEGLIITLPPHRGDVILTFDLHNRHTYSEELMKAKRGYTRYTAMIGAMAMDNTLLQRAAIQSEFRSAADLFDRIGGGAGPGGVKAVAPTGVEHIRIVIPAIENEVSLLGEKVTIDRPEGTATYTSPGRPIAVVSNIMIEFRPGPPPRQPPAKK
jgi:hypothetical protein